MSYHWDFAFLLEQKDFILDGLFGTLRLAVFCLLAGTALGLIFAVARLSRWRGVRLIGTAYVEFFRNIPVLVQIFWCYFAIPIITGWQPKAIVAAMTAISLYAGAYLTEIFRSGIGSIEAGQWDGARAIGFGYFGTMRQVILPQALRRILPAYTNQILEIVKTTTIASIISYGELLHATKVLSDQEFRPIESYTAVGAAFIVMLLGVTLAMSALERRLARHG